MKSFKKYYIIPATPQELYLALTNPLTIQLWSGEPAEMSTEPGSEFSLWEGSIVGKNLEFEADKKIVQEWYFGDQQEPSVVTIKLHPHTQGTSLELNHTNIPGPDYEDIVDGWDNIYIASLQDFYKE
jgi:activator of HSP90 ATPase